MRPTPKIIFLQEKETEKAAKVEEVLEQLKKEEK
jgi:ribosome-binding factor A